MRDPKRLAEAVDIMVERWGGEARLSQVAGISQPTVNRIRHQQRASLTGALVERLLDRAKAGERRLIRLALVTPDQKRRHREYLEWLQSELRTFGLQLTVQELAFGSVADVTGAAAALTGPHRKDADLSHLVSYLRQRERASFAKFFKTIPPHWNESREGALRVHLALLRVVGPLCNADQSGGVERSFEELRQSGQLHAYLEAGLAAQAILLKRDPAIRRAAVR